MNLYVHDLISLFSCDYALSVIILEVAQGDLLITNHLLVTGSTGNYFMKVFSAIKRFNFALIIHDA